MNDKSLYIIINTSLTQYYETSENVESRAVSINSARFGDSPPENIEKLV